MTANSEGMNAFRVVTAASDLLKRSWASNGTLAAAELVCQLCSDIGEGDAHEHVDSLKSRGDLLGSSGLNVEDTAFNAVRDVREVGRGAVEDDDLLDLARRGEGDECLGQLFTEETSGAEEGDSVGGHVGQVEDVGRGDLAVAV